MVFCFCTGDECYLVRVLSFGDVDGDPALRPQDHSARVPLHMPWRGDHGHGGPRVACEFTFGLYVNYEYLY